MRASADIGFLLPQGEGQDEVGTFPLPESQMDRFMMKISIGYPDRKAEKEILRVRSRREDLYSMEPVMTPEEVLGVQEAVADGVYVSDKILDYVLALVEATRSSPYILAGISTRGMLSILSVAKANAYFNARDFVIPEDVKEIVRYTIPHRVIFKEEYENIDRWKVIESIIDQYRSRRNNHNQGRLALHHHHDLPRRIGGQHRQQPPLSHRRSLSRLHGNLGILRQEEPLRARHHGSIFPMRSTHRPIYLSG